MVSSLIAADKKSGTYMVGMFYVKSAASAVVSELFWFYCGAPASDGHPPTYILVKRLMNSVRICNALQSICLKAYQVIYNLLQLVQHKYVFIVSSGLVWKLAATTIALILERSLYERRGQLFLFFFLFINCRHRFGCG